MSYLYRRIKAIKAWQEFDLMRYPLTSGKGDWYIASETMQSNDEAEIKAGKMGPKALLCLYREGFKSYRVLASVRFEDEAFPEKWLTEVHRGGKIVDALNTSPEGARPPVEGTCAECGASTQDDYLCKECRVKNE